MDNISGYIEQFVLDKLNTFNEGRNTDKGVYFILLPNEKRLITHFGSTTRQRNFIRMFFSPHWM